MARPLRQILFKITALIFAVGACGCYVWKAQETPTRQHLPSTKSIDTLMIPETRISGTKNITQPVFSTRKISGKHQSLEGEILPPSLTSPVSEDATQQIFKEQAKEVKGFPSTKVGVPLIDYKAPKP